MLIFCDCSCLVSCRLLMCVTLVLMVCVSWKIDSELVSSMLQVLVAEGGCSCPGQPLGWISSSGKEQEKPHWLWGLYVDFLIVKIGTTEFVHKNTFSWKLVQDFWAKLALVSGDYSLIILCKAPPLTLVPSPAFCGGVPENWQQIGSPEVCSAGKGREQGVVPHQVWVSRGKLP